MPWDQYEAEVASEWQALLASDPVESLVQKFLERNPAYLPGVDQYGSGHQSPQGGVLFTQPLLKGLHRDKCPDFMWIGTTSEVVTPVLIEIERPGKKWFTQVGQELTSEFHQAHGQLASWQSWFLNPENQLTFRRTYLEWMIWDLSRRPIVPHYILIYGRRSELDDDWAGELTHKRFSARRLNEEFMTYDRLTPNPTLKDVVTVHLNTSAKMEVRAIQPCFTTGPFTGELAARCESPEPALDAVPMWSEARRDHVRDRWSFWADEHRRHMQRPMSMETGE
ncbi:Shedu anti-phage system protein SduA domain-containing protein [Prescottella equi]|uniref:Shedu anti-phage system protein SduA domain-containing protein n=1 Tax=Rhodococcus hoagii TaxID=43767 RepID=UPI00384C176F